MSFPIHAVKTELTKISCCLFPDSCFFTATNSSNMQYFPSVPLSFMLPLLRPPVIKTRTKTRQINSLESLSSQICTTERAKAIIRKAEKGKKITKLRWYYANSCRWLFFIPRMEFQVPLLYSLACFLAKGQQFKSFAYESFKIMLI